MANAPFQTSGNVADIAPVQLKGGFTPAPGIIDAVADVAAVVVPAIRQNLEDSIVDDVSGKAQAVSLALKATRFPSIQESVFSDEALANPATQRALEEFTLIQDAVKQGRLPSTFALERLELAQNNAIKDAPEFEEEIRGAFRDATGQDPEKALFGRLLSETTTKTAEQKAEEKLQIEAVQLGITPAQLVASNHSAWEMQVQQQRFDFAARQGTYNLQTATGEVRNRGAVVMTDILADMRRIQVAGEDFNPDTVQALKNKINQAMAATTSAILAKTAGLSLSGTAINAELAPLQALQDTMFNMLDDGSMQTMISDRNDVTVAAIQSSILNMPEYAAAYAIDGGRGFVDLLEFIQKSGGTPEGKALASTLSGEAGVAFDLQGVVGQYGRIGSNEQLETSKEKKDRVLAAGVALGVKEGDEAVQIAALEDIRKYGGDALAWSAFESNKILTATATSNKLKAAFINMQVTTTAGLSQDLIDIVADPDISPERIVLNEQGTLQLLPREGEISTREGRLADGKAREYVTRFNRASRISAKYNGAGVLPATRYESPQAYWDTVRQAAVATVQPKEEEDVKVLKFVRDADGNIVLAPGGE